MASVVSVILVSFQSQNEIAGCLRHLRASGVPLEVIVIDNASSDGTVQVVQGEIHGFHRGVLIRNSTNLGFAVAVNQGIAGSTGEFLLLLNPDCYVSPNAISQVVQELWTDSKAGMAGCLLLNPDGTEQSGARRYIPTPWRALMRVIKVDRRFPRIRRLSGFVMVEEPLPATTVAVEAVSGAFMMVRRAALAEVGVLDEGYFMHCEDLDWCMRFRDKGWRILFVPNARAIHDRGRSSRSRPIRVEWHKHRGMVRFYRKFFRYRYPGVLMWFVVVAVYARFVAKAIAIGVTERLRQVFAR